MTFLYFSKKAAKNRSFFHFLKSRYFQLGGRRKTNLGTFRGASVSKVVVSQLFSQNCQIHVNLWGKDCKNSTARFMVTNKILPDITL